MNGKFAVIGLSSRFGKCQNSDEIWQNLQANRNSIAKMSTQRAAQTRNIADTLTASYLPAIDQFDPLFFNISPKEAKYIDPKQRILLEEAWNALNDAGYSEHDLNGSKTGVFLGTDTSVDKQDSYFAGIDSSTDDDFLAKTGNLNGLLSGRIAYFFNFQGPNMVFDCECSSGLVAVYEACKSLANAECGLALAGGISILNASQSGIQNIESPKARLRPFDNSADGTVWGEGAGFLAIKALDAAVENNDHIYGIIDGAQINSDGKTNGLGSPSIQAQTDVITGALKDAGITADQVTYVETHGTGTKLGDPIEFRALTQAFAQQTTQKQYCGLGTVKALFGHTVAASGIISLIKIMLSFENGKIPGDFQLFAPNQFIDFIDSPFYLPQADINLDLQKENYVGISSFGLSGTNCHLIVSNYVDHQKHDKDLITVSLKISFKNQKLLVQLCHDLSKFALQKRPNLADFCYSIEKRFNNYKYSVSLTLTDLKSLIHDLKNIQLEDVQVNAKNYSANTSGAQLIHLPPIHYNTTKLWVQNRFTYSKVDNSPQTASVSTNNEQTAVFNIIQKELELEQIDGSMSMDELGVDSIVGTKILNQINNSYNIHLNYKDFAMDQPLDALVQKINNYHPVQNSDTNILKAKYPEQKYPSLGQQEIFIADQMGADNTKYNINFVIDFKTLVDPQRLQVILEKICFNMPILNSSFRLDSNGILVADNKITSLPITYENRDDFSIEAYFDDPANVFDLTKAPLYRFKLVNTKQKSLLLCTFHHIIFDGYSSIIFCNDVIEQYFQTKTQAAPALPYKDYANWEQQISQDYAGKIDAENTTAYLQQNGNAHSLGGIQTAFLSGDQNARLNDFCAQTKFSKNNVLLTALFILTQLYQNDPTVKIDCVFAGRNDLQIENSIGPFSYSTPLAYQFEHNPQVMTIIPAITQLVQQIATSDLATVAERKLKTRKSHSNVLFVTQSLDFDMTGCEFIPYSSQYAKTDLEFQMFDYQGGLQIIIQYGTMYTTKFIERLMNNYKFILNSLLTTKDARLQDLINDVSPSEQALLKTFELGEQND